MRAGSFSSREGGFTYVWVLAMVAMIGVGLAAMGTLYSEQARREREQDLIRIGSLYAQAIASYYRMSPGSEKRFPPSIDALLLDTRFVGNVRHLRKAYADPVSPWHAWGLVKGTDGTLRGVFSTNEAAPLRREPLDLGITVLPVASHYRDWPFVPKVEP